MDARIKYALEMIAKEYNDHLILDPVGPVVEPQPVALGTFIQSGNRPLVQVPRAGRAHGKSPSVAGQ